MRFSIGIFAAFSLLAGIVSCSVNEPGRGTEPDTPVYGDYRILYQLGDRDDSVSMALAYDVQKVIKSRYGEDVKVFAANKVSPVDKEIIIGRTDLSYAQDFYDTNTDEFAYQIAFRDGKIFVSAGGSWALKAAVGRFEDEVLQGGAAYKEGETVEGTVRGQFLFPRPAGTTVRFLDDNLWQYDSNSNASAWEAIGENCTNEVRSRNFAALVKAYLPDILTFQEYSDKMKAFLEPSIQECGMVKAGTQTTNYTPIYYNTSALELKTVKYAKYGKFTPEGGSQIDPGSTKSYTLAVFGHKATGRQFMVVATHLWWKSNSAQAGSDLCRESEVKTLMAVIDDMLKVYDVPVFVVGDMNCKLATSAMKLFTNNGYKPLFGLSTGNRDGSSGYHSCDANGFAREAKHSLGADGKDCIDQFLLYNDKKSVEVKWFERIHAYFTIKLTDHYPNYADVVLK